MKAELDKDGKFFQFQDSSYSWGNPSHLHSLVDITGFTFDHENDEDFKNNRYIHSSGEPLFEISAEGVVSKRDIATIRGSQRNFVKYIGEVNKMCLERFLFETTLSAKGNSMSPPQRNMMQNRISQLTNEIDAYTPNDT